jgi:hypothetical protein
VSFRISEEASHRHYTSFYKQSRLSFHFAGASGFALRTASCGVVCALEGVWRAGFPGQGGKNLGLCLL